MTKDISSVFRFRSKSSTARRKAAFADFDVQRAAAFLGIERFVLENATSLISFGIILIFALALGACDKKDPILPGDRIPVFEAGAKLKESKVGVLDLLPPTGSKAADSPARGELDYIMSDENVLTRKADGKIIFRGFPTATKAGPAAAPITSGGYIYAGLSTGEVIKINKATGEILWTIDLGSRSLITGGSQIADISAMRLDGGNLFVSSIGGIFAKIDAAAGRAIWTAPIGTGHGIFISGRALAIIDLDGDLAVLDARDGALSARHKLKRKDFDTVELVREDGGLFWRVSNKRREELVKVE
ncbi:MAG: PQQ-like beta-propeller repeat protein [Rickettsiales bacterium]|jgi:hypothetical protein|nr:PQQ-like beta-propeller repeat protein [Rickettsiales bacterium]